MHRTLPIIAAAAIASAAHADMNPFALSGGNFSQDWSNTGLITANDDWSGVPSITGFLGDTNSGSPTGVDPQTYLAASMGAVDVIANQANPNTLTSGGVAEFDGIANPTVALQGSGTADTPGLVLYFDATGRTNVTISYNLRDIDGSGDNAIQQVALQYRIGGTGDFVNVPAGYVADASTGPNLATLVTPVTATNALWDNASLLEFRILTTNASGSDEWIGVDDITVTSSPVPEPATLVALALGLGALARRRRK
jgi:hypothetical protein